MPGKKNINIGVLASGSGSNLQAIIDATISGTLDAQVCCVISDNPKAFALTRAKNAQIPTAIIERKAYKSRADYESDIVSELNKYGVELVCLAGYMRIVGKKLLTSFPNRVLNIHPALLPSFPGLDGQGQAFEYGVKVAGCTVHFVDEKVDHGPIICQAAVEVVENDTRESLQKRILEQEHKLYPKAVQLYAEGRLEIQDRHVRINDRKEN
jgi:phosphoribosylglycinamide formyltransferase 1